MIAPALLVDLHYPVWICDLEETRIIESNAAAHNLFGISHEEMLRRIPADLGLSASTKAIIGPSEGPTFEASLHRQEIDWKGFPARMITAHFAPQPIQRTAGDTVERRYEVIRLALLHAGFVPVKADATTGLYKISAELGALLGLPSETATASAVEMMALVHPEDLPRYQAIRQASLETGEISETVIRIIRPDGTIRHIKVIGGTDLQNGASRFGLLQDITDAVIAEERDIRREALLTLVSDLARLGGWRRDLQTEQLTVTPHVNRLFGLPDGPFNLDVALGCFDAADQAKIRQDRERVHLERREIVGEYALTALDGTRKWLRIMQRPVIGPDDRPNAIVGAIQDITETVALRDAAEAQALRIRNMFDNMPEAFFLLDRDLRFTFANASAQKIFANSMGPDANCLGMTLKKVFPMAEPQLREPLARLLRDGQPFTTFVELPEVDLVRRVDVFATPDGIGMHHRDVTVERRTQIELMVSEERYRLAMMASQDIVYEWDIAQDRLKWSDAGTRFGYDISAFPQNTAGWLSIVHPGDRARMQHAAEIASKAGEPEIWVSEYRMLRADGSTSYVLDRSIFLRDADGVPVRVIGTISDISRLREEELRLRAIIDVAADAILEYDVKRNVIVYSEGMRSVFGHDWVGEQAVPTPWAAAVHPDDIDGLLAEFSAFCAGSDTHWRTEYRMARGDGSMANVSLKAAAIREADGTLLRVIGSMEDITQQRQAEDRTRQAERLDAIGNLTGGVAHDFNNLLTIVMGTADLLEEDPRLDENSRELAAVILRAAERGAELTSGLLAFAGHQPLAPKTLQTEAALVEVQRLLARTLPANIALQLILPEDLWLVEADPAQLNAAILNLAVNARDAMPDGGKLLIECANASLDEGYLQTHPDAHSGDFLRIAVSDTGTGMTPETAARVFEPFFTTKPRGAGTGMGLSMVRGFVQQSGGHVNIYTELGHGTTVSLYLPRSLANRAEALPEVSGIAAAGLGEHVLVVEDNPLLLPHVVEMIEGMGYRVSAASDATEAMAVLNQPEEVDLLFTDVVLPGSLNGPAVARLATELWPGLKVLFTSGYTENAIVHHGRLDQGVQLLSKPYRRHELARKLREVLDVSA